MPTQTALPATHAATKLPLRDYQTEVLEKVAAAEKRGVKHQLVSLPTGAGKTVVAAHLIAQRGWRTVFIVHRDELVKQSVAKINEVDPANFPGVCKAERKELGANTIIASAQTLAVQSRLDALVAATRGQKLLVISDEAHHDRAPSRTRAIQALAPDLLIGLTATPSRGDKLGLDAIYEEIVAHVSMLHLIARGILSPIKGIRIETDTNLDNVHTRAGEFAENELAEAVDSPERNKLIYRAWAKHAVGRKRTVVFAVNVAHAIALRDTFRANGVVAETILGETPSDERARILADFSAGKIPVLTNCMVLTEGYDEPQIDCELLARPTKSPGLYTQMVGRAARKAEGKTDALIIDFVDVTSRHKLITLPTLAGVDEDPDGVKIPEPGEEDREPGEEMDLLAYAQRRSAARQTRSVEVDLFAASQYIWRTIGGHHMAPDGGGTWLTLIPKGVGYIPARMFQSNTRGGTPRIEMLFDRPVEAETAMALAEASTTVNRLNDKAADWRVSEALASEKQIAFARVLKINVPYRATKGQVSNLIDEAMFSREIKKVRLN